MAAGNDWDDGRSRDSLSARVDNDTDRQLFGTGRQGRENPVLFKYCRIKTVFDSFRLQKMKWRRRKKKKKKKERKVQFSLVQDGIYALGKDHMRSNPSLRSFPKVAFDITVPVDWP